MAVAAASKFLLCAASVAFAASLDCGTVDECGAAGDVMEEGGVHLLQRKAYKKAAKPNTGAPQKLEAERSLEQERELAGRWLRSVLEGRLPPVTTGEVVAKFRRVAAAKVNASASDIEGVLRNYDKNKDDRLDQAELRPLFEPALEVESEGESETLIDPELPVAVFAQRGPTAKESAGESETETDPELPGTPLAQRGPAANVSLAQQGTAGSWQDYSCCTNFFARRYSEPRFFKPRVMFDGSFTVKGCALVSFILPGSSCYKYMYTNAVGTTYGMCRCFPRDDQYWPSGPAWNWYVSGSGNYIYSYSR